LDPGCEARYASVDARVASLSASVAPRADADNNPVVVERATGVTLALIATTNVQPANAQHVVGDGKAELAVAAPAGSLVHGPDLDVAQLLRDGTTLLQSSMLKQA
jgi:hypothetical protein